MPSDFGHYMDKKQYVKKQNFGGGPTIKIEDTVRIND